MGVKDLWKLLEPAGRPVKIESLQGLILAIDVSIWLNQAVKGMRDGRGEPVANAHLILLFHRICKLLYHRIKPVFVFDGATPLLKQQTLSKRHKQRAKASHKSASAAEKQVKKFLMSKILEQVSGEKSMVGNMAAATGALAPSSREDADDMFKLPPLQKKPEETLNDERGELDDSDEVLLKVDSAHISRHGDVSAIDLESEEFQVLPHEVQHELLLHRQEAEKYTRHDPTSLPQVADDFSNYQLSRLLNRSRTSKKLESVRSALKSSEAAIVNLGEESTVHEVESQRIVSSDSAHYILVKGADIDSVSNSSQTDEEASDGCHVNSGTALGLGAPSAVRAKREIGMSPLVKEAMSSHPSGGGARLLDEDGGNLPGDGAMLAPDYFVLSSDSEGEDGVKIEEQLTILRDIQTSRGLPESALALVTRTGADELDAEESDSDSEVGESAGAQPSMLHHDHPPSLPVASGIRVTGDLPLSVVTDVPSAPASGIPSSYKSPQSPPPLVSPAAAKLDGVSPGSLTRTAAAVSTPGATPSNSEDTAERNDALYQPQATSTTADREAGDASSVQPSTLEKERNSISECVIGSGGSELAEVNLEVGKRQNDTKGHNEIQELKMSHLEQGSGSLDVDEEGEGLEMHGSEEEEEESRRRGVEEFAALVEGGAGAAQERLREDVLRLERERAQQSRAAATVSNTMYKDAQELLSLFGIPYLVSPEEAEAQCAALEERSLTHGSITDDNDVFLFGGKTVYRHFFSQTKDLEVYKAVDIESVLSLSRERLVLLAYLLGSDYTQGLEGVGVVAAMEILRDFPGSQLEPLKKLKKWHEEVNRKPPLPKNEKGFQKKLRQSYIEEDFPNPSIRISYLEPSVDTSEEEFEWASPDLDMLRSFATSRIGWSSHKVDEVLLPVMKRLHTEATGGQTKITQFFTRQLPRSSCPQAPLPLSKGINSRRVRNAVTRIKNRDQSSESDLSPVRQSASPSPVKTRKRPATSGRGKQLRKQRGGRKQAPKRQKMATTAAGEGSEKGVSGHTEGRNAGGLSASSSSSDEDEFDKIMKNASF